MPNCRPAKRSAFPVTLVSKNPPYALRSERLLLRCLEPQDAEELARTTAENRAHLVDWMPWAADLPMSVDDVVALLREMRADFDRGLNFNFGIRLRQGGELIGGLGIHPRVGAGGLEIGYWIAAEHARRGLGTEAAAAATRAGIEYLGARWMEIRVAPSNEASLGIPDKLGYHRDATLRRRLRMADGERRDQVVFTLFADELAERPAARYAYAALDAIGRPMPLPSRPDESSELDLLDT